MQKFFMLFAAASALLATMLGALGSHALRERIDINMINVYQTGVQYQFYHSLALLLLSVILFHLINHWLYAAGYAFIVGTLLFSGSLYLLSVTGIKSIGIITPCGGLAFIAGWFMLFIGVIQAKF